MKALHAALISIVLLTVGCSALQGQRLQRELEQAKAELEEVKQAGDPVAIQRVEDRIAVLEAADAGGDLAQIPWDRLAQSVIDIAVALGIVRVWRGGVNERKGAAPTPA